MKEKIEKIVADFNAVADWEERYKKIIELGKKLPPLDESQRIEANRLKGCQSQLWLSAELKDGKVIFHADSDASIVKGIAALVIEAYSGGTPDEILQTKSEFLDRIGLKEHLTMNRSNGLSALLKQVSFYAMAFKAKLNMGK